MSKKRVHEVAKEMGLKSSEVIQKALELGMGELYSVSMLNSDQVNKIKGSKDNLQEKKKSPKSAKETKSRKRVVFINNSQAQTRSYSSDQRHSYVPKAKPRPKPVVTTAPPKSKKKGPKVTEVTPVDSSELHRRPAEGRKSAAAIQQAEKARQEKARQEKARQEKARQEKAKKAGADKKRDGKAPKSEGKEKPKEKTKKSKKSIIGTISNVNDYSRPMPMGRPSRAPSRPPAGGRPSRGGGAASSRPPRRDDRRPTFQDRSPEPVIMDQISKSGSSRRGRRRRNDYDKHRNDRHRGFRDGGRGDFDFGKKTRQKAGRYKEIRERERSEKLDEILQKTEVQVPAEMTVGEFAEIINKPSGEIIMQLMEMGHMMTLNHLIEFEDAALIAMDYNISIEIHEEEQIDHIEVFDLDAEDDPEKMVRRAPVVTVMGHVDHGKTSLLDALRNTGVADREAGGITQHIGASEVTKNGQKILFLDTPGHEAFTSLRARGAQVTDIAILVVAADDGVMPQTVEAIDHSKAAGVPIIVAINKIDKPTANLDRVKQELSEKGVIIEEWGGDVIAVPVSAKTGEGMEQLIDTVLLVAEVQDLKADPDRLGVGTVIEARVAKGRGTVATIIIEKGHLNQADPFVVGKTFGKVRAMYNDKGKKIETAGPSTSVEIDGLNDMPVAGERFYVTPDEKTARDVAERYLVDHRNKTLQKSTGVRLEELFDKIKEGVMKELNIIIKADVHGSVEAIKSSLVKLTNDEVKVSVIRADVGAISESDVILASASDALIIGFNVRPSVRVSDIAEEEGVDIRTYNIIYQAIDDVTDAMKGMLAPVFKEVVLGRATVREIFKIPNGVVAGCYVNKGKLARNAQVRIIRDGIVLFTGKVSSLRRFKDDVREVATGYECGLGIEQFTDLKIDDEFEAFIMEEVKH